MRVAIDSSALIASLCGDQIGRTKLEDLIRKGCRLYLPSFAQFEWLRGPRTREEIDIAVQLVGSAILAFGEAEAKVAASLFKTVRRAKSRQADIVIAATAMANECSLWTLNLSDFRDLPGLVLVE